MLGTAIGFLLLLLALSIPVGVGMGSASPQLHQLPRRCR
jgi:hypothetical protein